MKAFQTLFFFIEEGLSDFNFTLIFTEQALRLCAAGYWGEGGVLQGSCGMGQFTLYCVAQETQEVWRPSLHKLQHI